MPIKSFDRAKSRLASILTEPQRKTIARLMAIDTLQVMAHCPALDGVLVMGQDLAQGRLAARFACEYLQDEPGLDVSENATRAAQLLARRGVGTLVVVPTDLPGLGVGDLSRVISRHQGGVSLYRARRDGGTNVLIASPPDAIVFSFGQGSAKRHAAAASTSGYRVRVIDDEAFQRDVDTPDDLRSLSRAGIACDTSSYLHQSGLAELLAVRE